MLERGCDGYIPVSEQLELAVLATLDSRSRSKPELYRDRLFEVNYEVKVHGRKLGVSIFLKSLDVTSEQVIACNEKLYESLYEVRNNGKALISLD